ncbi:tRNA lysidine(34) synthetase TilS [Vibrio sonorensis]|uniref:tRNA lysidine(34) synthetase TilS n=1 Tax=Vibrio sonorensis TaxID=1004316 RepID=UPI0008D95F7E|nr:tRNA lysidine(34) synthetase TilS [Vibrio sonorensis]
MSAITTIFQQQLECFLPCKGKLVLALSGGMDSRVLLELLKLAKLREDKLDILAVHVHHGLSPNADKWAQQCQQWSLEAGIPCVIEHVQLDLTAGESVEQLARDARYQVLKKHIDINDVLLTGQHADDQVETFLLAMKRGSGPKGLSAMGITRSFGLGQLSRPLLTCTRRQVHEFAVQLGLEWVEDESNQDTRYDRNFLRHEVVPVLSSRWPHIYQSVQRSAEVCAQQERLIERLLEPFMSSCLHKDKSLKIETLSTYDELVRNQLFRHWFELHRFKMPAKDHLTVIWQQVALSSKDANPKLELSDCQVRRFNKRLYLVPSMQDISNWRCRLTVGESIALPDGLGQLSLQPSKNGNIALPKGVSSVEVVFDPTGLSAHPAERAHSRKLKKLFQEYGVPTWLRRRTPIIKLDQQVVAIADLFVSKSYNGQECELIWDK